MAGHCFAANALAAETRKIDPTASVLAEIDKHFDSYETAFNAGLAAITRGDWAAAAIENRDALRHAPRSADAWNNLGWSLAQLGFRDQAAQAYATVLSIRPSDERAANNLRLIQRK